MVAYSFQRQFAEPILAGTKKQTIRLPRKRHARAGEELQLFTGMRTKQCRLIGRATVKEVRALRILFSPCSGIDTSSILFLVGERWEPLRLRRDLFAQRDGFADWHAMREFWTLNHPDVSDFHGVLIAWEDFRAHQA